MMALHVRGFGIPDDDRDTLTVDLRDPTAQDKPAAHPGGGGIAGDAPGTV